MCGFAPLSKLLQFGNRRSGADAQSSQSCCGEEVNYNEDKIGINLKELENGEREYRKRKLSPSNGHEKTSEDVKSEHNRAQDSSDSSEEETEYDLKRKKVLEERERMLRDIGVTTAKEEVQEVIDKIKAVNKEKRKSIKSYVTRTRESLPCRASMRLKGQAPDGIEVITESLESFLKVSSRKPADPIDMKLSDSDSETISNDYLLDLKPHLTQKLTGPALEADNLTSFKSRVQKLKLSPSRIQKVVQGRVTAAAVHPSESNLLVAVGDKYGNIGFWDVKSKKDSISFQPHSRSVSHMTFSVFGSEKLISTSLDGTVRCGDLNKEVFTQVYASDEDTYGHHTCWHTEMSREVLLIAHGSGEVGVFDQREGKLSYMYKCHERSVRTVQHHPVAENYFVTGSGLGEARIWDLRDSRKSKPKPLTDLKHPKTLTGCFFSPAGNYLLTTCNDDRLRAYDTTKFRSEVPKVVMNIAHNNHVGRWLTTFKAKWHPLREDAFVIGSMMHPRRVQLYGIHGKIVHELMDPELQVVLSVCEFHPTQLAFVGGSSSGRIYAFV
ncbi:WD repeat-containing protein 76-like isoform X5 [Schistocerca nitens]|uniref:WD repeat-containing protein 76-like isoform X4 n=1 Tax=Schistocerca nitens TaxID=7011 RepID=UPI002117E53D|nr:WD repeat-containing protein 76-like isoform X4 [Schistocerca nitens]XP_049790599.1 WD repeat-containing protein 76-like isoform X5 [Schistocerca nitens]